jgi:hypothetical protein
MSRINTSARHIMQIAKPNMELAFPAKPPFVARPKYVAPLAESRINAPGRIIE